ncbi:GNAT family N-acetyltransferase [Leptolyngbya sp. PL-A3]|uniref:GNAT family N-acetyltransferase n=1 Tax=Leptolyngbya sp. PL-A3 TaxID=2933911 RepID=UPI003299C3C4
MHDVSSPYVMGSDRLLFRPFTQSDASLIYELDSDPDTMQFISKGKATPLERIEQEILPRWLTHYDQPLPIGMWATYESKSEAFIGWMCIKPDRFIPEMELGYRFKRPFWGKGYATEGSKLLINQAFTVGGLDRLTAHTLEYNHRSRRVMEKCGFRFQYSFVYDEEVLPGWTEQERQAVRYGLSRKEWKARA